MSIQEKRAGSGSLQLGCFLLTLAAAPFAGAYGAVYLLGRVIIEERLPAALEASAGMALIGLYAIGLGLWDALRRR